MTESLLCVCSMFREITIPTGIKFHFSAANLVIFSCFGLLEEKLSSLNFGVSSDCQNKTLFRALWNRCFVIA